MKEIAKLSKGPLFFLFSIISCLFCSQAFAVEPFGEGEVLTNYFRSLYPEHKIQMKVISPKDSLSLSWRKDQSLGVRFRRTFLAVFDQAESSLHLVDLNSASLSTLGPDWGVFLLQVLEKSESLDGGQNLNLSEQIQIRKYNLSQFRRAFGYELSELSNLYLNNAIQKNSFHLFLLRVDGVRNSYFPQLQPERETFPVRGREIVPVGGIRG